LLQNAPAMKINLFLKYSTQLGQSISVYLKDENGLVVETESLQYENQSSWKISLDTLSLKKKNVVYYQYALLENGVFQYLDNWKNRTLDLISQSNDFDVIDIFDDWQSLIIESEVFNTKPFRNLFFKNNTSKKSITLKKITHQFNVACIQLPQNKKIGILGSGKKWNNWDPEKLVLLDKNESYWSVNLKFKKTDFPLEFKFVVFDAVTKKIDCFEPNENRKCTEIPQENKFIVHNHIVDFKDSAWKGAGINIQLSSLKSKKNWGVGDFSTLELLSDWCKKADIKMIQLLPINDTIATYTNKDSYPYAAISVFALHPMFIDISSLVNQYHLTIGDAMLKQVQKLNQRSTFDYESVSILKLEIINTIFRKQKLDFLKTVSFKQFFKANQEWLQPYAVFCFLRDKYKTVNYFHWNEYAVYQEKHIKQFCDPANAFFEEIAFYYFTQYHLHVQLKKAIETAHKNGVIIKGDLPIGVGRFSVDTWMKPHLFHLDMQAGAPPDAFSTKGQNWNFPTYNWEEMKKENYSWWRKRLSHMDNYFDAIRIDHILGFFRIWSVPLHAISGIFGHFEPVIALKKSDVKNKGLLFDEHRYCDPLVNSDLIKQWFELDAEWVESTIIKDGKIKSTLNTEKKIEQFCLANNVSDDIKFKLFDLLADVILLKDENNAGQYHFRINMQQTNVFKSFSKEEQEKLNELYNSYFYNNQNDIWDESAKEKLTAIQQSTKMLICAEDLGMVPEIVEPALLKREILSLQVQRMPKKYNERFSNPLEAPYLTVVTPSTHDMSTIREWWTENKAQSQNFYNQYLLKSGKAPPKADAEICKSIIKNHLQSKAMWCVFLIQDLLSADDQLKRKKVLEERMNIPADPEHIWNYSMHITIEQLIREKAFTQAVKKSIIESNRG
jgi:4-alpha-glucanotransferase